MAWYDSALKSLDVPFISRYVDTRAGRTHLLELGNSDKPPLILVPGYGGSAPLWHHQFADLIEHHHIFALDIVGMPGRSAPNPLSLLGDDYTQWLADVMDALELPRADMAGVCLGGWIVMRMGIEQPDRVRRAVLLSPVGLARFKIYLHSGVPLILNLGNESRREQFGRRLLVNAFTPPGSNLTFDRQLARAMLLAVKYYDVGVAAGLTGERNRLAELWTAARTLVRFVRSEPAAELRKMRVPALLVVGQHEAIYNPQAAVKRARHYIPDVHAEIVPDTGHAAIFDRPEYVNPRIVAFLQEQLAESSSG